MAKKQVKELLDILREDYCKRANELMEKSSSIFMDGMVDPEVTEEVKTEFKKVSDYYNKTETALYEAYKNIQGFYEMYRGTNSLLRNLRETRDKVAKDYFPEASESEIQEKEKLADQLYSKQIAITEENYQILHSIWKILSLPRSKKRQKAWKRKGWWITQEKFLPLIELNNRLITYQKYLEDTL